MLVALADHGFTPSAIAARLTLLGAPESVQGAMAAGLLGGGSRYLGVTEDCGRFLADALAAHEGDLPDTEAGWDELAAAAVTAQRSAGRLVPGLGHPVHKDGDPRTPVIFRIAAESGVLGPHLKLFAAVGRVHAAIIGRTLPLNGAGVCGAALADLGFPPDLLRGFALLAQDRRAARAPGRGDAQSSGPGHLPRSRRGPALRAAGRSRRFVGIGVAENRALRRFAEDAQHPPLPALPGRRLPWQLLAAGSGG